jgi:ATP-binding protein involved in chromosome partitioning
MDPRTAVIPRRFSGVKRIVVVASGKGGVGKSLCASLISILAARTGATVGLLDMDFQAPTAHLFLGVEAHFPQEESGILPVQALPGLGFMSVALFTGNSGVPLRGPDVTNVFLELLAVTIWADRDLLVIDMPPGIGDEIMDVCRFVPRAEAVLVTTPSRVAIPVVRRLADVMGSSGFSCRGAIVNMCSPADPLPSNDLLGNDVPVLCSVPWSNDVEEAVGDPKRLVATGAATTLSDSLPEITGLR